ncbi:MAG: CD1871A family CXXC motif-containing protein [Lentihominibacter sp.]|jgi:hypothetical protein
MKKRNLLRGGILIAAVALIAVGIYTGDVMNVLNKAIHICFECIGLG